MAIDTVIFDMDDTLVDWSACEMTWGDLADSLLDVVAAYLRGEGYEVPGRTAVHKQYMDILIAAWAHARETGRAVTIGNIFEQCLTSWNVPLDMMDAVMDIYVEAGGVGIIPGVKLYDDTIFVLKTLKEKGYKIGLITNSMSPMWMRDVELKEYGIIEYFDARVTSGDVGYIKPHPAIYHHIMELLDTDSDHAIFVGDRPNADILGANRVGMASVWMKPAHIDYELGEAKPEYTISKLEQLLPILERDRGNYSAPEVTVT